MEITEIGPTQGPDHEAQNQNTDQTGSAKAPPTPINPKLWTSSAGPTTVPGTEVRSRYANYSLYLFEEIRMNNEAEILTLIDHPEAKQALRNNFMELAQVLSHSAQKTGMGTVLYHLDGKDGLEDSHIAEGMGLAEFCHDDNTFDMVAALAQMTIIREGERSPAAKEKEASYLDNVLAEKKAGNWGSYRRRFENLAVMASLARMAGSDSKFSLGYASEPTETIRENLRALTSYVMNTAIVYNNGVLSAFF